MRKIIVIAAGLSVGVSGAALAQTARNTPEGIVCAMTGSCETPTDGSRMAVGDEKAFSLARPSSAAASTAAPARSTAAPAARSRMMASTRTTAHRVAPVAKQPDGGLDMLVTFQRGSADLTPQAKVEARSFAQAMAAPQMAGMKFAIEGHTDSTGMHDKNVALSQARAQSVMNYLVSQGVDADRLTAKGYGPDKPLAGTSPSAPSNRRVEFVKQS